jgi:exonuclease III
MVEKNTIGNIFAFNCNGIGTKEKRSKVLKWLKNRFKGIIMLQETHSSKHSPNKWERQIGRQYKGYYSHGTSSSGGVMTIMPKKLVEYIDKDLSDDEGRRLTIKMTINNVKYAIINIYAPTQGHYSEQVKFYKNLSSHIEQLHDYYIIIGGDFNAVMNPKMDRYNVRDTKPSKIDQMLINMTKQYNLCDIWRVRNPSTIRYTWRRHLNNGIIQQSRIDMFIVSDTLAYDIGYTGIELGFRSDHSLIALNLKNSSKMNRGKGYWKLNNELLLDDKYCEKIGELVSENRNEIDAKNTDPSLEWDTLKMRIRRESVMYSKIRAKNIRKNVDNLKEEFQKLDILLTDTSTATKDNIDRHKEVMKELDTYENKRIQGAVIRARATWVEEGEKSSKYFLNLEKHNQELKSIRSIKNPTTNDTYVTTKDIMDHIVTYYQKLYDNDINVNIDQKDHGAFAPDSSIGIENNLLLESPITEKEIFKAINELPLDKSPGIDGLTTNFYKKFWTLIKDDFMNMVNDVYLKKVMTSDQRSGLISLLPKQDKDINYIKNWRPITILNTDYKILTKIMANRLKKILPTIINPDQTGFVLNRQIGENIRIVYDVMNYCNSNNIEGVMAFLDFEKAFDSISWEYLIHVLKSFGFCDYFINWVKIFYTQTNSSVMNNGYISSRFDLKRGIRQGCPISAYLFILCVELLAIEIRKSNLVEGLEINNVEYKILQFADDTVLLLKNYESLRNVLPILTNFYKISGLKLNVQKTVLMKLGRNCDNLPNFLRELGMELCKEEIRYLGIYFHRDENIMEYRNYRHRIENIRNILKMWMQRDLSLKGKVTVLKALAVSQVLYPLTMLSIPKWVIKELNTIFYKFLWNNGVERLSRKTVQKDIVDGGLRMIDLETFAKTIKIKWINRANENIGAKWTNIPNMYFTKIGLTDFCKCTYRNEYIPKDLPIFYRECLSYMSALKIKQPMTKNDVYNQVIWFNEYILRANEPFWLPNWYKNGIVFVKDLLNAKNELLLSEEVEAKYNIKVNFLDYFSIRQSIPGAWKMILKSGDLGENYIDENIYIFANNKTKAINKFENKEIYYQLLQNMDNNYTRATVYWANELNQPLDVMEEYYILPYVVTRECKVQSLQYKIINNIYTTRLRLKQWTVKPSEKCIRCDEVDDLLHHFCECEEMDIFWSSFQNWWKQYCSDCNVHSYADVLLGNIHDKCHFRQLNFIILYAKKFISKCKYDEEKCDFLTFVPQLLNTLKIEGIVYKKQKKSLLFKDTWNFILEY